MEETHFVLLDGFNVWTEVNITLCDYQLYLPSSKDGVLVQLLQVKICFSVVNLPRMIQFHAMAY